MFFIQALVLVCLRNNIPFRAKHLRGVHNTLADSLSQLQDETFQRLAPFYMENRPRDIPLHLQP